MAVSFVAKGTWAAGTTSFSPGIPAGMAAGDLMLLVCHTANHAVTTPSGWTQVTSSPVSTGTAGAAGGTRLTVFYRWWQSGDAAPSVAVTGGTVSNGMIFGYRGVDATTPFDATPVANTVTPAGTTLTWAGITTATAGALIFLASARDQDLNSTAAVATYVNANLSGITERHDQVVNTGVGGGICVADGLKASAGATGNTTATQTSSIAVCLTIALRNAPIAASVTEAGSATNTQSCTGPVAASAVEHSTPGGKGFFGGGYTGSNSDEIDGIQFATEAAINTSATLSAGRQGLVGVESTTRGYFGGGSTGSDSAEIDGLQFSDETAINPTAALSVARSFLVALTSPTIGYFMSGSAASTEIDGIRFSDEAAVNPTAVLGQGYTYAEAGGGAAHGYLASLSGYINKFVFSTESAASLGYGLAVPRSQSADTASDSRVYFGGGYTGVVGGTTSITGIILNTDATFTPSATLATSRSALAGVYSLSRGYYGGGSDGTLYHTEIDGLQFSDEAAINPSAALATARYYLAGVSAPPSVGAGATDTTDATKSGAPIIADVAEAASAGDAPSAIRAQSSSTAETASAGHSQSATQGYAAASVEAASAGHAQSVQATFAATATEPASATDASSVAAVLAAASSEASNATDTSSAGSPVYAEQIESKTVTGFGYVVGGTISGSRTTSCERLRFSDVTLSTLSAELGIAVDRSPASLTSGQAGYAAGGADITVSTDAIQKLRYLDETTSTLSAVLAEGERTEITGLSSSSNGYVVGGNSTGIDGLAFATETATNPTASLSLARSAGAGIQSSTRGYFCGGWSTTWVAEIDGIQFSDESAINPTAVLSEPRFDGRGLSASTHGYVCFGRQTNTVSTVDRFQFSNETMGTPTSIQPVGQGGAVGTQDTGYYLGGLAITPFLYPQDALHSVNYSTDMWDYYIAYLSSARYSCAFFSTPSERFDGPVATDTADVSSVDWAVSVNEKILNKGTGAGYFTGSEDTGKLAFETETATTIATAMSSGWADTAVSGTDAGYVTGGYANYPEIKQDVTKLLFSSDTISTLAATLSVARTYGTGINAPAAGYIIGGDSGDNGTVEKLVFATEVLSTLAATIYSGNGNAAVASAIKAYINDPME